MPTRTDATTYTPSPDFDANPEAPYTWADVLALAKHWDCTGAREDSNGDVWVVDGTPGEVLIATRDAEAAEAARV